MSDVTSEHKRRYLGGLQHRMQKLVDEMSEENHDKPRCQSDVNIVKQVMEDVAKVERLEMKYSNLCNVLNEQTAEIERLEGEVKMSGGLKCPSCEDIGWYPVQTDFDEWEQQQCEFCYTIDGSIFNRRAALDKEQDGR